MMQSASTPISGLKALTFDVFGTVVDWRSSVIEEGTALGRAKGIEVDWARFADAWRGKYQPFMDRVRRGDLPWTKLDDLHRVALDELLREFQIEGLSEAEKADLNLVWRRLKPWPEAVEGLTRLKARYIVATLSNGNVALLVNMAKHAHLPWDCVLSAELVQAYKPDPRVYQSAADLLGLRPDQVMMVAAHTGDLRAAAKLGLRTAFVSRPLEHGPGRVPEPPPAGAFDIVAAGFVDLADKLRA